ncbi:SafA/ExsA family spore coat assembly protein [Anaerobacillus sp. CMMVII]|uniref:SafA/ExsA family spore coat assembly protein n=1 Tax=Anaerobacillus sp. CMMVII TaxID=2755588 RepID=UPI0021B74679|nr:SafA/ExsA family spore coat assembly protein [Anaerobacillus sp. CMMVII]MCT8139527.1 SafA/ExsA family spore coat assembly protein [Anaerobacillus sp. CMMVII]
MKIHIVQQGDTLWKLAKKYDVDFEQLKAVNNHLSNPDVIMPGMKIKIPTGGVPVKKQAVKKEEQVKAQQPKELPKVKEVPLPKHEVVKEEVKLPAPPPPPAPVQQPIQVQPITQQQYLHHMNMNFNVYKPAPAPVPIQMPAPPKLPEMKELPKFEKPKQPAPPKKEMPIAEKPIAMPAPPKKEMPIAEKPIAMSAPPKKEMPIAEMPMAMPAQFAPPPSYPMQQNCYPVTGIMPGCAYPPMVPQCYPPYPGMAQPTPYGYPVSPGAPMGGFMAPPMQGYQPMAMAPQMPMYPQPQQMPMYPPPQFGMTPPAELDFEDADLPPMTPSGMGQVPPMQVPPGQGWAGPPNNNLYGDITMQQPMLPQGQPWGYQPQPMFPQYNPTQGQQFRNDKEDNED